MSLLEWFALDRAGRARQGVFAFLVLASVVNAPRAETEGDPDYPGAATVAGSLSSIGSETMAPLMELWAEDFKRAHPGVDVRIQSSGSFAAPPALADGVAHLAPMSRMMNATEMSAFVARRGYQPTPVQVAVDAVMVVVHRANPIRGMSLAQLDAVFSSARKCGPGEDILRWGQLGLSEEWQERPVQVYSPGPVSGTRDYFRQQALCGGDFKNAALASSTSPALVRAVGNSLNAIGYVGLGHMIPGVRSVPLAVAPGAPWVTPSAANALAGTYPLARYLYIYIDKAPGRPLPSAVEAWLRMGLSERGQRLVARAGYIPLPSSVIPQQLTQLR
ncbi:MAG TPA: phosphate ABC transporter substrate-binding protein PstS family protein [Methylococcaceae bacterium]|nr:phosphate ABC transporter substrate-binding protein PstS family protein [Methylococcaceae bacterium]